MGSKPLDRILHYTDSIFSEYSGDVVIDESDTERLNSKVTTELNQGPLFDEEIVPFVEEQLESDSDTLQDPDYNPEWDDTLPIPVSEAALQPGLVSTTPIFPDFPIKTPSKPGPVHPELQTEDEEERWDDPNEIEPPISARKWFLTYLARCAPVVMVVLFIVLLSNVSSVIRLGNDGDGYLHHRIYLLEKQLKGMEQQQKSLVEQLGSLQSPNVTRIILANGTDITDRVGSLQANLTSLNEKVDQLDEWMDKKDQSNLTESELDYIVDKLAEIPKVEPAEPVQLAQPVQQVQPVQPVQPPPRGPLAFQSNGYGIPNYANTAHVISQLTTIPHRKRVRKGTMDRILHGFSDFAKRRIWGETAREPIFGFDGVDVTSQELNNPNNALIEDPKRYWQALTGEMPICYTLSLREPIYLKEAGISQPRYHNTLSSTPKVVELFVRPSDFSWKHLRALREKLSAYYNQDFQLPILRSSFVNVGSLEYDTSKADQYQKFPIPKAVAVILTEFQIDWVMFVIDSNYGNENITVLNTVRIFGMDDSELRLLIAKNDQVPALGDDIPIK